MLHSPFRPVPFSFGEEGFQREEAAASGQVAVAPAPRGEEYATCRVADLWLFEKDALP